MNDTIVMSDGDPREFEEINKIKVTDGMEYDALSKLRTEWIESRFDSPTTMYDEAVPWQYWKGLANRLTTLMRSTRNDELRHCREMVRTYCRILAKNEVNAHTPFKAQIDLYTILTYAGIPPIPKAEILRCYREESYKFFNSEWLGRKVG
jgi:hypothetical protein